MEFRANLEDLWNLEAGETAPAKRANVVVIIISNSLQIQVPSNISQALPLDTCFNVVNDFHYFVE